MPDHYEKLDRLYRIRIHCDPEPAGDEWPTLKELQHFVGGYVEHVLCRVNGQELHLFINEDGRRLGLPPNVFASAVYAGQFDPVKIRTAIEADPSTLVGLTIVGNAWLWIGELPPDA